MREGKNLKLILEEKLIMRRIFDNDSVQANKEEKNKKKSRRDETKIYEC